MFAPISVRSGRRAATGLVVAAFVLVLTPPGRSAEPEAVPFDSPRWSIEAKDSALEPHLGRPSLRLQGGGAVLQEVELTNGVIEFDIAIGPERGFMGGLWRMQDNANFEQFYLRPHQSGKPDSMQYTPVFNSNAGWQLYHGEGYGAAVTFPFNQWIQVKIVFSGGQAEMYVDSREPVLFAHDLKRQVRPGKVGVYCGSFAPAHFSNFRYQALERPTLRGKAPEPKPVPAGMVMNWSVSSAFPEQLLKGKARLTDADTKDLSWTALPSEPSGIANLSRVQGKQKTNTAFARLELVADAVETRAVDFGYSDKVRVYLNGRLLYAGDNTYRSRDFRYLGTIGLFDTAYLPLEAGKNEVLFAVTEAFGGWGIMARVEE